MKKDINKRNPAFDLLRIISLIGVIVMHVTSGITGGKLSADSTFILKLIYNAPFHYGVPIFVMISGALFLNPQKEINIKKLWIHNILRIVIAYLVWSTAYGIYDYLQYKAGWKYILWEIVTSSSHLWFLPMLFGLYVIVPFLATWVRNASKNEMKYFFALFMVFQIVCETIKALPLPEIVNAVIELKDIQLVCSYVGYFVLGYYLIHIGITKKLIRGIYVFGIICGLVSIAALVTLSFFLDRAAFEIVDSYSIFTFGWVMAIFIGVNRMFDKNSCLVQCERDSSTTAKESQISGVIAELGIDSFGAYLSHIFVIRLLMEAGFSARSMPVAIGIPVFVVIVFLISTIVAALLRRIPYIGRYIC